MENNRKPNCRQRLSFAKLTLSLVLVLFIGTHAFGESSVWKVRKGNSVMYLGGTCHVLRAADLPLPPEFDRAYRSSTIVVFETDLGEIKNPATQQQMIEKAMYTDGSTVRDHISDDSYRLLEQYFAANGLSIMPFKEMKPSMIILAITSLELAKFGVTQEGVDSLIYETAKRDGKTMEPLESVEEQIDFIAAMGEGNEDEFVRYSMNDLASIKEQFENIVAAWKTGNTAKMNELFVTELKTAMPKLYSDLIVNRNRRWLPVINEYLTTPQQEFVLVGAAHLVGPDGILEALREKGYKIEKL